MSDKPHPDLGDPLVQDVAQAQIAQMEAEREKLQKKDGDGNGKTKAKPLQLEEVELLKYQLQGERLARAQMQIDFYEAEVRRSKEAFEEAMANTRKLMVELGKKYNVNLQGMQITKDGKIIPRARM